MHVLGLSKMHKLTAHKARPVRFRAWLWNNTEYQIHFQSFRVENSSTSYTLRLEGFNRNASSTVPDKCGSQFLNFNDLKFSTVDRENDISSSRNCAVVFGGAGWWYNSCTGVSPNVKYCSSESCGTKQENIIVACLMGHAYSMKRFQIDLLFNEL